MAKLTVRRHVNSSSYRLFLPGVDAMRIRRFIPWSLLALTASMQVALADGTDVSGRWVGKTQYPSGAVSFTIDVEGARSTFTHSGFGPEKTHPAHYPITIRLMQGREGEWVYFQKTTPGYASFDGLNGLLSRNGQTAQVRQRQHRRLPSLYPHQSPRAAVSARRSGGPVGAVNLAAGS